MRMRMRVCTWIREIRKKGQEKDEIRPGQARPKTSKEEAVYTYN